MSRFRRRLMGLAALRQTAADDFVRVEYIENTSTAYIISGIFGTMDLDFYIEFEPTQLYQSSNHGVGTIFGSRTEYNRNAYQLTTFNKNATNKGHFLCAKNYGYSDNRVPTANMFLGGKNIIKKEGLIFTRADGTTFNLTSQSFTTPSRICIFVLSNVNGGVGEYCKFKLYKLQFSKNGTLVRDFIPMYQKSTDTYGLWDRVEEKFYTSPNGVKFTGGQRVIADADDNIYFFRNYIDLLHNSKMCSIGLYPNFPADGFEAKIYWPKNGRNYVMGAWTNSSHNQFAPYTLNERLYVSYHTADMTPMGNKMPANEILTIKAIPNKLTNKFEVYLNGIFKTSTPLVSTTATNKPFYIGKINGATTGAVRGTKLYSLKYWRNEELVRDYIPVERCSDGVFGVFDKVRNVFQVSEVNPFTGA